MNNEEKILAILESMSKEIKDFKTEMSDLKTEMGKMRKEMNERMDTMEQNLEANIKDVALTFDDVVKATLQAMEDRDAPIYRAVEENRQAINLLAKPLVLPPLQKKN